MSDQLIKPESLLKLSVSKTKTFIDCQKNYKFTYIDKFPRKTWDFHLFGTFCHNVLELFHLEYLNGSKEEYKAVMSKAFKTSVNEFKNQMEPKAIEECKVILGNYLKTIYKNGMPNVTGVEKRFELPIENTVLLNGAIDRIQIDPDGVLHIADYKSTKDKKYLVGDYFQLLTYCYVMLNEQPDLKKIRASYIMLRHNFEYLTEEFDAPKILAIKNKYMEYAKKIMSETEYAANPSFLCKFCSHLERCAEGSSRVKGAVFVGETNW